MPRLTWLADELRNAGLRVVEVDGWRTRGSTDFHPEGVTWHATAGSRTSTAQAEVGVILRGSTTAPPPIAQLMLYRDGTYYVCAAGRCNHNKVGWDGPNKGLGNTRLLGIEMANDNRGEPWSPAQLDAARRGTAAIMRRLGADPMRRLAGHYEHQPYATRPPGEGSTKSDPFGVDMRAERPKVAALMKGDDIVASLDDLRRVIREEVPRVVGAADVVPKFVGDKPVPVKTVDDTMGVAYVLGSTLNHAAAARRGVEAAVKALAAVAARVDVDPAEVEAIRQALDLPTADENAAAVIAALRSGSPDQTALALRVVLGDQAAAVGRILAEQ